MADASAIPDKAWLLAQGCKEFVWFGVETPAGTYDHASLGQGVGTTNGNSLSPL